MPRLLLSILCLSFAECCNSQGLDNDETRLSSIKANAGRINDSVSVWIMPHSCKNYGIAFYLNKTESVIPVKILSVPKADPFIKVHGNVLYNFSYRSYLDTPFAQTGLMQHQFLTTLNVTVKNKYPVQVQVGMRNNNSPYFKNSLDINITYSHRQLMHNIKDDLREKMINTVGAGSVFDAEYKYREHIQQAQELRGWINSPARIQEIIEEREQNVASINPEPMVPLMNTREFTELGSARNKLKQVIEGKNAVGNLWASLQQRLMDSSKTKLKDGSHKMQPNDSARTNYSRFISVDSWNGRMGGSQFGSFNIAVVWCSSTTIVS